MIEIYAQSFHLPYTLWRTPSCRCLSWKNPQVWKILNQGVHFYGTLKKVPPSTIDFNGGGRRLKRPGVTRQVSSEDSLAELRHRHGVWSRRHLKIPHSCIHLVSHSFPCQPELRAASSHPWPCARLYGNLRDQHSFLLWFHYFLFLYTSPLPF